MTRRIYTANYRLDEPMKRTSNPDKAAILSFLGTIPLVAAAAGHFTDSVTGEEVDKDWLAYEAGGFTWDTCDIYHFEKYDLELSKEFCDYALSR